MSNRQQLRGGAPVYNALKKPTFNALKTPSIGDQGLAAINGFGDSLPFGLGNATVAAIYAARDHGNGVGFGRAWQSHLAAEQAHDRDDAVNLGKARLLGQVAGTGVQLLASGGLGGAAGASARMAEHAPLIGREIAALAGAGAGSSLMGQGVSDLVRGERAPATAYVGAALGGAAGGLAALSGSGRVAGEVSGATTAAAQAILRGEMPSPADMMRGAVEGSFIGAAGDRLGRSVSDGAPPRAKGQIGEAASQLRSTVRGLRAEPGGNRPFYLEGGGYTRPDHLILQDGEVKGLTEAKFGTKNSGLTKRQQQGRRQFGDQYRVDHFLPQDVGAALGTPTGVFAATAGRRARDEPR